MITIFSKFLNLDEEKRERIINAALKEFALKGYEKASTNEIVKEANISKGLLFHYFNKKKDLFLFLYDYTLELLLNEFYGKLDSMETDIIIRFRESAFLKMELMIKHPEMFNFLFKASKEEAVEVRRDLEQKAKEILAVAQKKLFGEFDASKFREGIDIQKAIEVIYWTLEGFARREQEKITTIDDIDFEPVLAEMDLYLELLRNCFYK